MHSQQYKPLQTNALAIQASYPSKYMGKKVVILAESYFPIYNIHI